MPGSWSKVSSWLSRNIGGGGLDYSRTPMPPDVPAAAPEGAGAALGEQLAERLEGINTLKDAAETVLTCIDEPGKAAQEINHFAVGQQTGLLGTVIDDVQHDPHRIAGDLGWGVFGFFQGVAVRVLARLSVRDDSTANPRGSKPSGK